MAKSLADHSQAEIDEIFAKIKEVYDKHKNPVWLKNPALYSECVNILNAGMQQSKKVLTISGKAPTADKDLAATIKKELEVVCQGVREKEIEVAAAFGVGSQMGQIEKIDKVCIKGDFESGKTTLEHQQGQVLLLDFWATWCPPCQAPMAHNQKMLESRGADWGDNVRIIGLSIDQQKQKLIDHVRDKGWTKVEHYWSTNGDCTADTEYGVQGVPHVLLVDKTGKIVFMGHPASRKIEEDIDNLLKGVALTGEGTSAKDEEAKEGDAAASKQPTDGELKKFEDDTKAWVSEAKSLAEGIDRAFLVLTCNTVFDVKNGSTKKEAACHTVILGGTKAKRDALEEETKKHSQNPNWKNERRVDGPP